MGQQQSSLSYMKRFSMCSCLTVYFPETYTVHGVSVDVMNKKARPGKRVLQPYTDLWEPHWGPCTLKIPSKIDTFLYSPFAEAISDSFRYPGFDKGRVRYVNGSVGGALEQQGLAWRYPQPSSAALQQELQDLEVTVERLWGPDVTKILVFYDYSRGLVHDRTTMKRHQALTREVFKEWPVAQVRLQPEEPFDPSSSGWNGWEHYGSATRKDLLEQIEQIEAGR